MSYSIWRCIDGLQGEPALLQQVASRSQREGESRNRKRQRVRVEDFLRFRNSGARRGNRTVGETVGKLSQAVNKYVNQPSDKY